MFSMITCALIYTPYSYTHLFWCNQIHFTVYFPYVHNLVSLFVETTFRFRIESREMHVFLNHLHLPFLYPVLSSQAPTHTHAHETYHLYSGDILTNSLKLIGIQNLYIYLYIHTKSSNNHFLFIPGNKLTLHHAGLLFPTGYLGRITRAANPITWLQQKHSVSRSTIEPYFSLPLFNIFSFIYMLSNVLLRKGNFLRDNSHACTVWSCIEPRQVGNYLTLIHDFSQERYAIEGHHNATVNHFL
jgi:hypothetical protein